MRTTGWTVAAAVIAAGSVASTSGLARAEPAGIERRLYPDRVDASSFLQNDWNRFQENYHPNYVADDDPKTAWTEGAKGSGAGQWLRLHVTELDGATRVRLRVRNGYHKSRRLFRRNARARRVTVTLRPSGATRTVELADDMSWQEIVATQPAGKLSAIELRFDSVYEGSHYEDLCVSDVQVFVTATTPDNPAFEKSKRDRLLAWKRQRLAAARLFRKAARTGLPLAAQYREGKHARLPRPDAHDCEVTATLCRVRAALGLWSRLPVWRDQPAAVAIGRAAAGDWTAWRPVRVTAIDKRPIPQLDALMLADHTGYYAYDGREFEMPLGAQLGFLRADHLKRVTVDKAAELPPLAYIGPDVPPACRRPRRPATRYWLPPAPAGAEGGADGSPGADRLTTLLVASCGMVEMREGMEPLRHWQLLVYDDAGRLAALATEHCAEMIRWDEGASGPVIAGAVRACDMGDEIETVSYERVP